MLWFPAQKDVLTPEIGSVTYLEEISNAQGTSGTLSQEQVNKVVSFAKRSLQYSNKVLDEDLDKLDRSLFYKTLADKYESLFREGLRLYISAWEEGDPIKGLKANNLLNKWGKYYRKFRKKFGHKNWVGLRRQWVQTTFRDLKNYAKD